LDIFYLYLAAVGNYWWAFMMAGPFIFDEAFKWLWPQGRDWLSKRLTVEKRRRIEIILMIFGVFLAGFLAFRGEHIARMETEKRVTVIHEPAPTKNRSKIIASLGGFYVSGSAIQRGLLNPNVTDDQIDAIEHDADKWLNETAAWIQLNMGVLAASRFTNNSDKTSHAYTLKGEHKPETRDKRNNILDAVGGCLINLDNMLKSDQWDPQ
jgi:hypothetical protein